MLEKIAPASSLAKLFLLIFLVRCTVALADPIYAWGSLNMGRFGNGEEAASWSPVQVGSSKDWVQVSAGDEHSLAVKSDGTLWAWGSLNMGRFGNGQEAASSTPIKIGTDASWVKVEAGNNHSLGLKTGGKLWVWGSSEAGGLGGSQEVASPTPTQVESKNTMVSIGAGRYHSLGLFLDLRTDLQPPQIALQPPAANGSLTLEICAPQGVSVALEVSGDMNTWIESQRITGQGNRSPVKVTLQPDPNVQTKFWRVRVR